MDVATTLATATSADHANDILDSLLERGAVMCASGAARNEPAQVLASVAEAFSSASASSDVASIADHEVRGMVLESLGLQSQLLPVALNALHDLRPSAMLEVVAAREADPLEYLHSCPVPVARLMLQSERGLLASFAVIHFIDRRESLAPWKFSHFARTWRDGVRATARLYASFVPRAVPDGLVQQSERLDIAALAETRRSEDEFLKALVDAHHHADVIPVHGDAATA